MMQHLKKQYILWAAIAATTLIVLIGFFAFVIGKKIGSPSPSIQTPLPTPPFPTLQTSTPTPQPTRTNTPVPTGTPTSTPTSTPTPTPTPRVIITDVKSLGRLETAQFMMQTVIDLEREPTNIWEQILGTDKLLLVAGGEVVAGFDLTLISQQDIIVRGDQVTITLPPPQILYSKVDNDQTYVYERTTGLFSPPDPRIESQARKLAEEAMIQRALEGEILKQAETNGRMRLEVFLRSLGFTDIVITVRT
jgi:hypothetical protein